MDLCKPAVYPCWERFVNVGKIFINNEEEFLALCAIHGEPIVYTMLRKQKEAIANVDAVVNQDNQKIVYEAIKIAKKGQWKKPR